MTQRRKKSPITAVIEDRLGAHLSSHGAVDWLRKVNALTAACAFKDRTNAALQALLAGEEPLRATLSLLRQWDMVAAPAPGAPEPCDAPWARRLIDVVMSA